MQFSAFAQIDQKLYLAMVYCFNKNIQAKSVALVGNLSANTRFVNMIKKSVDIFSKTDSYHFLDCL